MSQKAFTVRLSEEEAAALERVAEVDRSSVAQEIREAVRQRIEERRSDPEFQQRLRRLIEENQQILEKLAK